jgi:hypothetical protein
MLAFGKSYTWDDGIRVTVGKPKRLKPSRFAVGDKAKRYVRFTVTVVNKSDNPLIWGLTYIGVQSSNEEAHHLFDSLSGLRGPPDTKVLKGRKSEFDQRSEQAPSRYAHQGRMRLRPAPQRGRQWADALPLASLRCSAVLADLGGQSPKRERTLRQRQLLPL